jgi:DnaJ-class molecular chaperone
MTYYEVLGVPENVTPEQLKKQYRRLSLEYHPDRPTGNATKFKEINEAYETLSDDIKRKQYDRSLQPQMDIFEMLFRNDGFMGPMGPMGPAMMFQTMMKPPPLTMNVNITLDQAYTGCKLPIKIERWTHVNHIKQLDVETLYIDIPQGIDSNECLLLQNKGNMGPDGILGDVRITVQVSNTTKLERRGIDLWYTHEITLKEALCGFSFDMKYLQNNSYRITNAKGNIIHPDFTKVLPEMGMKRENMVGNLIIRFHIVFPSSLSEETMTQLETLL